MKTQSFNLTRHINSHLKTWSLVSLSVRKKGHTQPKVRVLPFSTKQFSQVYYEFILKLRQYI